MLHSFHLSSSISTHAPLARRDSVISQVVYSVFNFYSRASCEARPKTRQGNYEKVLYFYSRASCEARLMCLVVWSGIIDFYSRASCEARLMCLVVWSGIIDFYSRASCEARPVRDPIYARRFHFYSRASCEARLHVLRSLSRPPCISTHAPLARRDMWPHCSPMILREISTHAPLARRDQNQP